MVDSQEKYNLTTEKIECGHCLTNVFMRIICEGGYLEQVTYLLSDHGIYGSSYHTEHVYHEWQVLKCLSCSEENVIRQSLVGEQRFSPTDKYSQPPQKYFLYPLPDPYKEKPLELKISNEVIEKAIADVEASIHENKIISGVDRIHTALHGYFRLVCTNQNISFKRLDNIVQLFALLRDNHPKLQNTVNPPYIKDFFRSVSTMLERFNSIRNDASLAHGNENLLDKDEALFYINLVRLLIRYLDKKLMS